MWVREWHRYRRRRLGVVVFTLASGTALWVLTATAPSDLPAPTPTSVVEPTLIAMAPIAGATRAPLETQELADLNVESPPTSTPFVPEPTAIAPSVVGSAAPTD